MTSRERILAAINHQPVDRVPTDIWATQEVWDRLIAMFGPHEEIHEALHIDGIVDVRPAYIGPPLPPSPPDAGLDFKVFYGIWGAELQWMEHGTGRYLEQVNYPFAEVKTIDDLKGCHWPSADWFDYAGLRAMAEKHHSTRVVQCGYMAPIYLHNLLRGMEQSCVDPLSEPELTHELLRRVCDFEYEYHRRMFQACEGLIDVAQVTDDLGNQAGPMYSLKLYREFYKPHHKRFIGLCREFGINVFHHDDGSMRAFLPDLLEIGIDILNPVQWNCPGMELGALKRDFGQKLCFHGGIENQRILPFGTPAEVRAEVRHCIDALASDHTGYILAPCHNLQSSTPIENIIAMYDEAWNYGRC
ncbi:MAG: uroporphyrinogen-III decarboxylase-like protein [Verrucomicrobia bacterium]|nr:uroporphyrinogen-III decarboxylase-like protein [Verrucomicrobiota bacterium]